MSDIKTVGLLGGGVIGAGWAARCLLNGLDVVVCDPDPEAERKLGEVVANAERAYRKMTLAPLTHKGRLSVTREIEDAALVEAGKARDLGLRASFVARPSGARLVGATFEPR